MTKTIDEIQEAKRLLEAQIATALDQFSTETKCYVNSVNIDRVFVSGCGYTAQVDIRL
jgi:hypothetical protein